MCNISVEPIPSSTSTPVVARNWRPTSPGSASAADTPWRTLLQSISRVPESASSAAYSAGTEKNTVGWCVPTRSAMTSGVGRPVDKTVVAPTDSGNHRLLPSPYA